MTTIHHQAGIKSSPRNTYAALTTNSGLATWWTRDTSIAGDVGSVIKFRFGGGGPDFRVAELIDNKLVRWEHSGNTPEAWMGTEIIFKLQAEDEQTLVRFSHVNWKAPSDFLAHCSTKWTVFLLSLKDALEMGQGKPFPDDIPIDHT